MTRFAKTVRDSTKWKIYNVQDRFSKNIYYVCMYVCMYVLVMCDIHDMNIYHDINDGDMI